MRWKVIENEPGDVRVRTAFLFFPKRIGEDVRWLEKASWVERFDPRYSDMGFSPWKPQCWGTEPIESLADFLRRTHRTKTYG